METPFQLECGGHLSFEGTFGRLFGSLHPWEVTFRFVFGRYFSFRSRFLLVESAHFSFEVDAAGIVATVVHQVATYGGGNERRTAESSEIPEISATPGEAQVELRPGARPRDPDVKCQVEGSDPVSPRPRFPGPECQSSTQ